MDTSKKLAGDSLGDFIAEVELARTLGISRRTLHRNFTKLGPSRCPARIRLGRKVIVYKRSEVVAFFNQMGHNGSGNRSTKRARA